MVPIVFKRKGRITIVSSPTTFPFHLRSGKMKLDFDLRAAFAELIVMTLFLYFSLGASLLTGDLLMTSLTFGLAVATFIYVGHHSKAGHMNPVVSVSLAVAGYIPPMQAVAHVIAQLLGSVTACGLLKLSIPDTYEMNLGANEIQEGFDVGNAFVAEIMCTFALQLVIFETILHPRNKAGKMGPFAVGLIVFVVHGIMTPIDNCGINPARTFGPAIVANVWDDIWVFLLGPTVGGLLAIPAHIVFLTDWGQVQVGKGNTATGRYTKNPAGTTSV